jgi:hypothetical protein
MWFRSILESANSASAGASRRTKKRRPQRRRAAARLPLEALEARCLLTFMAQADYAAGQVPVSVVAADLANNGIQDLVVANGEYFNGYVPVMADTVSVLAGKGNGTFGPPRAFATGASPVSVAVGDLTGDGKLDIVTGNNSYGVSGDTGSVSVLLGNGDGTFQPYSNLALPGVFPAGYTGTTPLPQAVTSVAVGDMNRDGHPDVVVTAEAGSTCYVDVLLGNGRGGFSVASITNLPNANHVGSVKLADFGNGNLDVAVTSDSGAGLQYSSGETVLLGNGDGTLGTPTTYATFTSGSLAVGDVNGDGKLDLVAAGSSGVSVLLGNGNGTFQAAKYTALPAPSKGGSITGGALVMGDLNADGKLDLAVTGTYDYSVPGGYDYSVTNVNVLLGNGDGTFAAAETIPLEDPASITAADFNGDGYPDLAVTHGVSPGGVQVLINQANWTTAPPAATSFALSGFPASTMAGTAGTFTVTALNPDGTVDTGYTGTVRFTSSDGQAALPTAYTFTEADAGKHSFSATLKTAGTQSITATDATTGTLAGSESGINVTPAAASHFSVSVPAGGTAGNAISVTVTALDPYNNTATGYAGTVHFTSSDGQASLPGNCTFTASDAGVYTLTSDVTLKTAGSQTVTVTDTSSSSITGGAAVSISPAAASAMIVAGFSSPITAGVAGSLTVTLKDAYGNIATGYTGTVHFTSSDAEAALPANYTFTSADAGKHTFSVTLKTAGTQSITEMDTVSANLQSTDSDITVKSAAASKFVLSAPSSIQPGVPLGLTVTVEDAYGNIVTGYVGTVHFKSSDSQAKLPVNYTFTASDGGAHTFAGLVLKKAGNQTITATDTKNSSITGKTIVDVT